MIININYVLTILVILFFIGILGLILNRCGEELRVESSSWIKRNTDRIKKKLSVFTLKAFYPLES
jgi:hypothetical protein